MKFGRNLSRLSVPEWKGYNIDYNELKYRVRDITQGKEESLVSLRQAFVDEFERVNLFIKTKNGEHLRKLDYFGISLEQICSSLASQVAQQINIDDILFQLMEMSMSLNNLSRFIVIQKIACKKIFKKFEKHYANKKVARKFIMDLYHILYRNPNSFVNFDLSEVTDKLTSLTARAQRELERLNEANLGEKKTKGLIKSTEPSIKSSSDEYDFNLGTNFNNQHLSLDNNAKFDLTVFLHKNFKLDFLIPEDSNNMNEVIVNLCIYHGLERCNRESTKLSYIYLQNEKLTDEPSFVISQKDQRYSILVGYIGGLRRYSYCVLPNEIMQAFIEHLVEQDEERLKLLKSNLRQYFYENKVTNLTKSTIDAVLGNRQVPRLKVQCLRSRFILRKNNCEADNKSLITDDGRSSVVKKKHEDDYLATLDSEIFTTQNPSEIRILDSDINSEWDSFPYGHLAFHSNDSKLSNFYGSLSTEIKEGHAHNVFSPGMLKKIPSAVQRLINDNNSANLFKDLNLYQYSISCYYNIIPEEPYLNNHYSNILNLDLIKSFENVENYNKQIDAESNIVKAKSQQILNHKMSLASPQHPKITKNNSSYSVTTTGRQSVFTNNEDNSEERFNSFMEDTNSGIFKNGRSYLSALDKFVLKVIHIKDKYLYTKEDKLLDYMENNYDSINDDNTYLHRNEDYEDSILYETNFDHTLELVYFTLTVISILIAGIEMGILYSILQAESANSKFTVLNNLWLILTLILGLLLSLIFSLLSINLNFQRFNSPPLYHSIIIWTGFIVVCLSSTWSTIILIDSI